MISDHQRLSTVLDYYRELSERLGTLPTRHDLDPVAFYSALPSVSLVEIHRDSGRLRFRLVGQEILNRAGSMGLTGRWLDELGAEDEGAILSGLFGGLLELEDVAFESGEVSRDYRPHATSFAKLSLPLAAAPGEPPTALVAIVFTDPPRPSRS